VLFLGAISWSEITTMALLVVVAFMLSRRGGS